MATKSDLAQTVLRKWGKLTSKSLFRRRSIQEHHLQDDFPDEHDESDLSDTEQRKDWQRHLNQRSKVVEHGIGNKKNENYFSDHSSLSIIDAFAERRPVEVAYSETGDSDETDPGDMYEVRSKRTGRRDTGWGEALTMNFPGKRLKADRKSPLDDKIRLFDNDANKNADRTDEGKRYSKRRENACKNETKGNTTKTYSKRRFRPRVRHNTKQRVSDSSPDDSETGQGRHSGSRNTVQISMDDLNSLIKKNISTAVTTIVSARETNNKSSRRPQSTEESMSTESETIFSGSSSQSLEQSYPGTGGMMQKQIKAQLDKDRLCGNKRMSMCPQSTDGFIPSLSNLLETRRHSMAPTAFDEQHRHRQQNEEVSYMTAPHQHQSLPQQPPPQPQPPPPRPPPPPPQASMQPPQQRVQSIQGQGQSYHATRLNPPQVTFTLPTEHDLQQGNVYQTVGPSFAQHIPSSTGFQPSPELSLESIQNQFNQLSNSQRAPSPSPSLRPFDPGWSVEGLARLQSRRHTLADLDSDNLLSSLKQVSNIAGALSLLDKNSQRRGSSTSLNQIQCQEQDKNVDTSSTNNVNSSDNTDNNATAQVPRPVLSIQEQIDAIKNAKKKPPRRTGDMGLTDCARALLVVFNIVFMLAGAGISGVGTWLLMDPKIDTYFAILNFSSDDQDLRLVCMAMCGVGGLAVFISLMGCCGGIRGNKCMLTVFVVLVGLILLSEIGMGVMIYLNKDQNTAIPVLSSILAEMEKSLRDKLTKSVLERYDPDTAVGAAWDLVQVHMECCGCSGQHDYTVSIWKNKTENENMLMPDTCCVLVAKDTENPEPSNKPLCQAGTTGFSHDTGCFDKILQWCDTNSSYILAVAFTVAAVELAGLVFALCICRKSQKTGEKVTDAKAQ